MKYIKLERIAFFIFSIFLISSFISYNDRLNGISLGINDINQNQIFFTDVEMLDNYTIHAPILIDSNIDFETLGCSGNGTSTNPYIIEGFNITQTGQNAAIKIKQTSSYFVINSCLIVTEYIGILLDHIGFGTGKIINNICISSSGDGGGIGLSSTSGCNITNNECSNFMAGIHFNYASSNIIYGNLIFANNYQGINIRYSSSNIITFNTIQDSVQHGLALVGTSSSNIIHDNLFINNSKIEQYDIDGERTGTINSQGYDEGSNNKWYKEAEKRGNRWSDYNGEGSYSIDGPSEAVDLYPMLISGNESLRTSLSLGIIVILVAITSVGFQLIRRMKKGKHLVKEIT